MNRREKDKFGHSLNRYFLSPNYLAMLGGAGNTVGTKIVLALPSGAHSPVGKIGLASEMTQVIL